MVRARPNLAFCTVWAARTAPAMYRLGLYGDVLTLTQLAWPASVKPAPASPGDAKPDEVKMALVLADQLSSDFDPETFRGCATQLSLTVASAKGAVDADDDVLLRALERFRLVHVGSLHAVADAATALAGDLDLVVDSERETQFGVAMAFSAMIGLEAAG